MNEPDVILSEVSPYGNVEAVVEQDDRVVTFYLFGAEDTGFGVRSCWVRNLQTAPESLDVEAMRNGIAPMLHRDFCAHPSGDVKLEGGDLHVVWFEEGDAAALLHNTNVLAIIPGWSGYKEFSGYARDCLAESSLAWPLGTSDSNALYSRIEASKDFWAAWATDDSPWPEMQDGFVDTYQKHLGKYSNYYAIDSGEWPPKAMLRIPLKDSVAFVTLGVSVRAQPKTDPDENSIDQPRRIELGICLSNSLSKDLMQDLARYVSGQSGLPWSSFTCIGNNHTIPCDAFRNHDPSTEYTTVLLLSEVKDSPKINLPVVQKESVELLWMIPITDQERQIAIEHGSNKLVEYLESSGRGWVHVP